MSPTSVGSQNHAGEVADTPSTLVSCVYVVYFCECVPFRQEVPVLYCMCFVWLSMSLCLTCFGPTVGVVLGVCYNSYIKQIVKIITRKA